MLVHATGGPPRIAILRVRSTKETAYVVSILLIEDEAPLSRLIVWSLVDAGFAVAVVPHCADAILRVDTFKPAVIVFNTVIADENKARCIDDLRAAAPDARIIDVSAEKNARARGMIQLVDNGVHADAYLDLPFPADDLIQAIRELVA